MPLLQRTWPRRSMRLPASDLHGAPIVFHDFASVRLAAFPVDMLANLQQSASISAHLNSRCLAVQILRWLYFTGLDHIL
jgi:hypothetical protein